MSTQPRGRDRSGTLVAARRHAPPANADLDHDPVANRDVRADAGRLGPKKSRSPARYGRWRTADRAPFAEMNFDPEVMKHYPTILSPEESDASADRIADHFTAHGFGLWAVEIPGVTSFAGYVGLSVPRFEAPFTPCVEIGWRLARPHWGYGYATEAAKATLAFAFDELQLKEVVSFTVPANIRSRKVMERLGMTYDPRDDFEHPLVTEGPLRRHVLYRRARAAPPNSTLQSDDQLPRSARSLARR